MNEQTYNKREKMRIALFGHFGKGNFGNEITLQAFLCRLRSVFPDVDITCICTGPQVVAEAYNIKASPISYAVVRPWSTRNPLLRIARKLTIGIASECYRWFKGIMILRNVEALVIPGTGLLTDAYSLVGWGPFNTFKWSLIAKISGCKLIFASVGVGPLYSYLGRIFVRTVLSIADFRSYRDNSTLQYVRRIGLHDRESMVSPDLAFSYPESMLNFGKEDKKERRKVVGLGLMEYAGRYSVEKPSNVIYRDYLDALVSFAQWLLDKGYDIRFLFGDVLDRPVIEEFKSLLRERQGNYDEERIIDEPVTSVENLLAQLSATDFVVATRFHNVLMALLLNKPTLSISFHHKCTSLMHSMDLSEYSQDINDLSAERLILSFCKLEQNADSLKPMISRKIKVFRSALDEQYDSIFRQMGIHDAELRIATTDAMA